MSDGRLESRQATQIRRQNLNPAKWLKQCAAQNRWGSFDDFFNESGTIDMGIFGAVPKELVCRININELFAQHDSITKEIEKRCNNVAGFPVSARILTDDELTADVESFRRNVGAFQLQLRIELAADIALANDVVGSFWKCFWHSFVSRKLVPHKYYSVCGAPSWGYGTFITDLANIPESGHLREAILEKYRMPSWNVYVDRIWQSKNQLMEMEREYRDTAVAITQVGIGIGGMLLGLVGLAISVLIAGV